MWQATWSTIYSELLSRPAGTRLWFYKNMIPHPIDEGAQLSAGWPVEHEGKTQQADYRFDPDPSCRGLHVQEYDRVWIAHVDRVHPKCDLVQHLRQDAPVAWHLGGAAIGAAFGAAIGRSGGAALVGAGLGLLIAAALRDDESDPTPSAT